MRGQSLDEVLKLEAGEKSQGVSDILGISEEPKKD
jgi:hypothetical protein